MPQSLTINLPLTPSYEDEAAQLAAHTVAVTLDLSGGERTFVSEPVAVGTYRGLDVRAQLAFVYAYDPDENKLTIHGNDDRTDQQLTITTYLSGAPDQTLRQAPSLAFRATPNDLGRNAPRLNLWAEHVGRRPVFVKALSDVARGANEALVKGAIDGGVSAVLQLGTPPLVTLENLDDWKRMFGEPLEANMTPDRVADVARMQFKVNSTYVGTVTWAANADFANVIGSTYDPKVPGYTWIGLWSDKCNGGSAPTTCASQNFFGGDTSGKTCNTTYIGGHVITGQTAMSMPSGSTVYIYPICTTHNANNGYYMESLNYHTGVQLKYWVTSAFAPDATPAPELAEA